ncbi:MAG: NCS2 family permease [Acutalibacteraceae bacterium]|nr:NCS2 family permease [Acutalibacteraceae bacterium]
MNMLNKLFRLKEHNTDVKTEIIAGITTFLAMAYILAVNPAMLADAGMDSGAVFTATAVSAAFATLLMGLFANYPVVLASGMGLNAYFAYTVCPMVAEMGIENPWQIALTAILFEGIVFVILSLFKFRETLVNSIPQNLKYAISAGIGLFITIVGLKGANIVIDDPSTLVNIGNVATPEFVLAMVGLLAIGVMWHFNIKGSILWGIILTWVLGIIAELIGWYQGTSLIPDFSKGFLPPSLEPTFMKFDFGFLASHTLEFIAVIFAFLFVDLFDTVGTLVGVASQANLLDKDGKLPKVGTALTCDAVGTIAGAMLGTSTVTSYVESTAGVAAGGRTGLTAISSAVMFILALFLSPVFLAIPGFATAPALVFVGLLMMKSVKNMTFDGDIADVLSGFIALVFMPFTYSIANGIMYGILTWVILKVCTGKIKEIHPIMWVVTVLFAVRIVTLII